MKNICNGYAFAALLSGLWLLAEVFNFALGGAIDILLVTGVIVVLIKFSSNRNRTVHSEQRARSRKRGRDLGAQKNWQLK